jgi:hypothetical protein
MTDATREAIHRNLRGFLHVRSQSCPIHRDRAQQSVGMGAEPAGHVEALEAEHELDPEAVHDRDDVRVRLQLTALDGPSSVPDMTATKSAYRRAK